jgi:hypothetical protein
MRFLRKNTAAIVSVGPFYDKTDGVTPETALTITNERITLVADTADGSVPTNILDNVTGATSGTDNDLNYITGNDAGMMQLELTAANTNRNGSLLLSITDAANHCPVFHEFQILPQPIYDALMTGAAVADGLVLCTAAYKLAVDSNNKVAVPDTQKVDVDTIKTKSVTVDAGGTTFPASIHAAGAAVAKSPATLAAADVSGNLPVDVKAYTVQPTVTGATLDAAYDAAKTAAPTAEAVYTYFTAGSRADAFKATGFLTSLGTNAPADWLNAAAVKADAVTKIQNGLAPANTALSNATWIDAKAAFLDAKVSEAGGTGAHLTALATQAKQDTAKAVLDTVAGDVAGLDGAAMRGTDNAYTGTPPTADAIGTDAASKILASPDNKLATDAAGAVTPTSASKTGYALAATGLDQIPITAPTGPASTFREMVVQTWRRFFRRATKTSTQLKTYADNGTTVVTTQAVSDDGTTETQGEAS